VFDRSTNPFGDRPSRVLGVEDYFAGRYPLMAVLFVLHQAWFFWLVWLGRKGLITVPTILIPSLILPAIMFVFLAAGNTIWDQLRRCQTDATGDQIDSQEPASGRLPDKHWRRDISAPLILFDAIALCFATLIISLVGFMLLGLVWFRRA